MPWLILAVMGAGAYLYGLSMHATLLCLISKAVPVLALLGWLQDAPPSAYRRWISIGLMFSLLGDILLAWPVDLFVYGLGAFLFAHLAYLKAYLVDCRRPALPALALALLAGISLLSVMAAKGLGDLLIPVCIYALTISAMLWRALARLGVPGIASRSAWLGAGGALLFVLSDSLIGINRFVSPFAGADVAIILTYWFGQLGIAASAHTRQA